MNGTCCDSTTTESQRQRVHSELAWLTAKTFTRDIEGEEGELKHQMLPSDTILRLPAQFYKVITAPLLKSTIYIFTILSAIPTVNLRLGLHTTYAMKVQNQKMFKSFLRIISGFGKRLTALVSPNN